MLFLQVVKNCEAVPETLLAVTAEIMKKIQR